jgi:hypothetical protein
MKVRLTRTASRPPLPLSKAERIEVRGSETAQDTQNPHPILSLGKGEANQAPMQSKIAYKTPYRK